MNTKHKSINQVIAALFGLEAKGYHSVCFEYENCLFRARIIGGEVNSGKIEYERTINPASEHEELDKLLSLIETLRNRVINTEFQCYKREFIKGEKSGEWVKIKPIFEVGNNATSAMQIDGGGYFIDDPENGLQYYVDMKHVSDLNT